MNVWTLTTVFFLFAALAVAKGEEDLTGTVRFKRNSAAGLSTAPREAAFKFRVKRQFDFGGRSNERYESRENSGEFTLAGLVPQLQDMSSSENELLGIALVKGGILSVVIKILAAVFLSMQGATTDT